MATHERTVRKAGIVDVNSLADFMQGSAAEEQESSAASRLLLSHLGIEHGEIWIVDDGMGIEAAALWLPPHPEQFARELDHVVHRELHVAGAPHPQRATTPRPRVDDSTASAESQPQQAALVQVLATIDAAAPDLILSDVRLADFVEAGDRAEVVWEVIRPVLAAPVHSRFAALAIEPSVVGALTASGFRTIAEVPFDTRTTIWVGTVDFRLHAA